MPDSSLRIVVTGLIAQHPSLGGISWHYLQYVLGLTRLGHEVYYFEDSGQWPYNFDGGASGSDWISYDCGENVTYLNSLMRRCGLENRWAYRFPIGNQWYGLSDNERTEIFKRADILLNVSGSLEFPDNYRQIGRLVYIDTDPVFTQVKLARGERDFGRRVDAHDVHFSYGEYLSNSVPRTGHIWQPTRQPIVLSEWHTSNPPRNGFTTVMSWTSYKPLAYADKTYGQKDLEFYRFLELPRKVKPVKLELSLSNIEHVNWRTQSENMPPEVLELKKGQSEWGSRDLLTRAGWNVVDAKMTCGDLDSYRNYIQCSKAEWSVAKSGYVQGGGCGWFSERSACYLASSRPVVVQDTGFSKVLPVGNGLFAFNTIEEAAAAIETIEANYTREAEAARAIAEEYFASDRVLTQLVEEVFTNDRVRIGRPQGCSKNNLTVNHNR
jgi:glycosyltransferase involved in cell wall biosynthesis